MLRAFLGRLLMMVGLGAAVFAGFWIYAVAAKKTPEQKLAKLEADVASKGGQIFRTVLSGKPRVFLLQNCSLYLLDAESQQDEIKQTKVLSTGFYFFLDACTDQSITTEGEYLEVYLANRAIGAGGGNTSGGNYRSKDGITWQKQTRLGWKPVEEAQP